MDQKIEVSQKLQEWACSLSGCDGGYIKAETWLCGIEWGWEGDGINEYYATKLPEEINNGAYELHDKLYDWKKTISTRSSYGKNFAKLYTAIEGGKVEDYKSVASLSGEEIFKMNLYPIPFKNTKPEHWRAHNMHVTTGFPSKDLFNMWCFFKRFPEFSKLREEHGPKLIIGTGVTYLRDFLMFFGGDKNISQLNSGTIEPQNESNKYDRTYYWLQLDERTLLVVIPFFSGRYGLNSNYLLQQMGDKIRGLLGKNNN